MPFIDVENVTFDRLVKVVGRDGCYWDANVMLIEDSMIAEESNYGQRYQLDIKTGVVTDSES
ncbi:MAG: hypothetical protein LBQ95_06150 [Lachnospiraceae bacterium]|nr:hypothetical protein [Lachnospiraceae bacterium]